MVFVFREPGVARAAAKKSWRKRDLPNWRDRVTDLVNGKQIILCGVWEGNGIYVAARRKGVRTLRFRIGADHFAVVARGRYSQKLKFIQAGNVY
jgi:hypothetical protein